MGQDVKLTPRTATIDDLDALKITIRRAIDQLQSGFLTPDQIRASHQVMGLDTQLLRDGTYFMLLDGDTIAGCGGRGYRKTPLGGGASVEGRGPQHSAPANDDARKPKAWTETGGGWLGRG